MDNYSQNEKFVYFHVGNRWGETENDRFIRQPYKGVTPPIWDCVCVPFVYIFVYCV